MLSDITDMERGGLILTFFVPFSNLHSALCNQTYSQISSDMILSNAANTNSNCFQKICNATRMILGRIIKHSQTLSLPTRISPVVFCSRHWSSSSNSLNSSTHMRIPTPLRLQLRCFHKSPISLQTKSAAEESLIGALASAFPAATDIAVVDVSGGCGAMYEVFVEAPDFANMRTVKQHQLVTKALSSQIKDMHGIRISTAVSTTSET